MSFRVVPICYHPDICFASSGFLDNACRFVCVHTLSLCVGAGVPPALHCKADGEGVTSFDEAVSTIAAVASSGAGGPLQCVFYRRPGTGHHVTVGLPRPMPL